MTCLLILYVAASLAAGVYFELVDGDPRRNRVERVWSVIGFAVLWPVMVLWAVIFLRIFGDDDDLDGPWW